MDTIKIAGVPEHFNLPWHLCIENKKPEKENINLIWTDVPEGTGKLCQMLRNGETDIAVILTEGIIKDIAAGNESTIVQVYVKSPLIWSIHVAADSNYNSIQDVKNGKAAISRYGSGSHLMAIVNAKDQGWNTNALKFETVNTLDGAVKALTEKEADYFMWERFMTKPIVDKGIFRRIGDCPTPWPSFVIAVRNEFLNANKETVGTVLDVINHMTCTFKEIPDIDKMLSERYGQKREDIKEWLSLTQWSQQKLDEHTFNNVQEQLSELGIIEQKTSFEIAAG
jgi:ABC-type nitrate/sulfonate/bicarbonate transport system substrate-binding protein